MLNNFIYAQTKDLFLEKLNAGEVLDEAIVFIEDTKEIWNHGHYFAGESIDPELLEQIQTSVQELKASIDDNPFEKGDVENSAALKGGDNQTTSECEVALGKYNASNYDTQFSIGIGTSEDDRKNAFEVKQNGDIYIEGIEGRIQDKLDKLVEITYSELKSLRDDSKLIPGQQYRITDYVTTTAQNNTRSAGHQFDIIVTADDENTLNEAARACMHEGDTYFADSDLNAWELKYCLDNDTERFAWADAENGKGVIYRMIDEWNNDIPYDFKNILFMDMNRYKISAEANYYGNWWAGELVRDSSYDVQTVGPPYYAWVLDNVTGPASSGVWYTNSDRAPSIDAIFYEYDGSEFYVSETIRITNIELGLMQYTFGNTLSPDNALSEFVDYTTSTLDISSLCSNNIIKPIITDKQKLNFILFGSFSSYNTFGSNCLDNSFGHNCRFNSFGNGCNDNSLGNGCHSNSFGHNCYYNSLNNDCNDNSLGNSCYNNSFGDGCYSNSFGNDCGSNSFGNGCYGNSFGEFCNKNSFGYNCNDNTFGNNCYDNTFGNSCSSNSFGNSCSSNSFGNSCSSNSFGASCNSNSFGTDCIENRFVEYCCGNMFGMGCIENKFGIDCNGNKFGNYCDANTFSNECRSNSFGNACGQNSLGNYCSNNSFGTECRNNSFISYVSNASAVINYCRYNHFDDGCSYNVIWNNSSTGSSVQLKNININRGVSGTASAYNRINIDTLNADYEIQVAKNSKGEIKIYCEADLIA